MVFFEGCCMVGEKKKQELRGKIQDSNLGSCLLTLSFAATA